MSGEEGQGSKSAARKPLINTIETRRHYYSDYYQSKVHKKKLDPIRNVASGNWQYNNEMDPGYTALS
ncbi:hypothetical protein GBA52_005362 [Prunus armeniaca]|nr:hypothetical protein GBA52_005362 [Prunus armeniaca]